MSEYNKRSVVLDHNFPVMPIILMAAAIILRLVSGGPLLEGIIFHACAVLMIMGMILHRMNLQILTGIGTLGYALYSLVSVVKSLMSYEYLSFLNVFAIILFLLVVAAYTVAGLHYVLRRPKPGKSAKLILMIPLTCLWIIYALMLFISVCRYVPLTTAVSVLINHLSFILMTFALMIYTPFREA